MKITKNIPFENLDSFLKKIDRFNGKALKFKKDLIQYEIKYPIFNEKRKVNDLEGSVLEIDIPMISISVDGVIPIVNGYEFLAKIEHRYDEKNNFIGNIVKTNNQEIDSSFYSVQNHCEHCKSKRNRKETFILKSPLKIIQVGKECLKDFLNSSDLESLLRLASFLKEMNLDEDIEYGRVVQRVGFIDYISVCIDSINKFGWVPKKNSLDKTPTYLSSWNYFYPQENSDLSLNLTNIDLVKTHYQTAFEKLNDNLKQNIKILEIQNLISLKDCPIVALIAKQVLKCEEEKIYLSRLRNEFSGQIGEELEVSVKITKIKHFETRFGVSYLIEMIDTQSNNVLKTFTTSKSLVDLKVGENVLIFGRVKDNEVFNNQRATVLRNVKIKQYLTAVEEQHD